MVLFGVHLFLRGNEIMDLGFFSIINDNTIYNNDGTIDGLFVQIFGKTEKAKNLPPVTMILWAIPTHLWLCPIKYLLLLVRIVGHSSGYFL